MRLCNTCEEMRDESEFPPSRPRRCRQCHTEYVREHRARNRDAYRRANAKYEAHNLEHVRRRVRNYHKKLTETSQITATRKGQPWTQAELNFITEHPEMTSYQLAIALDRTYRAIHYQRHLMNV